MKGNDNPLKKLWIVKHILLVSTFENAYRAVWGVCILMLGCKGLIVSFLLSGLFPRSYISSDADDSILKTN